MRNLFLILSCLIFAGCGNLENSWTDFRAYYNTYYNAQENFRAGLSKVEEQPLTIDPNEPVRIHHAPVQAGGNDFQKAIDKGARILRKFPDSKWVDDALLLIGKSYYYRQEFYSALQKFEELRNASASPKLEQLAIIWKGRTQLDLNTYTEGLSFLESELNRYPNNWSAERKGEIQVLAAEHHAMLENWEQASDFLSAAVSNIRDQKLLGQTFFLYGQVLEQLERYGESYFTFSKVSENFPGFEYQFWARFKQGDVARKEGNLDLAMSIYETLLNDDKNSDRRNELTFEVARTLELQGEIDEAELTFKNLLYDENQQRRSLNADIYYRLGKIYSDHHNDYELAAAYFDSSSTLRETPEATEDEQGADILADAFGKYTDLKATISRADSLMRLGQLTEGQLDSALNRIRAQKRRKLVEEQESEAQNMLANEDLAAEEPSTSVSSAHGFLNYRDSELVTRSQANFRIIWGNRPLIDNWRRMEVVRGSNARNRSADSDDPLLSDEEDKLASVEINVDEIPQNQEEMNRLKAEKANAQYELGNLFFLNIELPDSARYYFHNVINNGADDELHPRAMYSLFELFTTTGDRDSLQYWGQQIMQEYPDSRFARRVKSRLNGTSEADFETDSVKALTQKFQDILSDSVGKKPQKLRQLALTNRSSELASHIYYQSIEQYILKARQQTGESDTVNLSNEDSVQIQAAESRLSFNGASWDSVRFAIEEFDTTFPNAAQQERVAKLREMLNRPEMAEPELSTCEDQGISLKVQPSMDQFLASVNYPEKLNNMSVSGKVVYSFVVNEEGEVDSFELISQKTSLGIEEALEQAFQQSLSFAPLKAENPPEKIKCEVSFPIQR